MSAPQQLDRFRGLREEARICASCGSCRASCPTYERTGWESCSPRARVMLADQLLAATKKEDFPDEAIRRTLECTLCGSCKEACPAGIDTRQFLLEVREQLHATDRDPEPYRMLAANLAERGNVSSFDNSTRADWVDDLDEPEESIAEETEEADVGYFVGCVASFYPAVQDIPLSFAQVAARMGKKLAVLGEEELCCGFPLIIAGRYEEAANLIRRNLERVERMGLETLVTGCPSCYHTWSHVYAEVAGRPLNVEVVHLTQYLQRCMEDGSLDVEEADDLDEVVTFHDPCDLGRNSGVYAAPRDVLRSLPGVELVEMLHNREEALCCGGGGNLQSLDADLTRAIADRRVQEAVDAGATVLVSSCQQCVQVLADAARRNKLRLRVMDIIQLVLEAVE